MRICVLCAFLFFCGRIQAKLKLLARQAHPPALSISSCPAPPPAVHVNGWMFSLEAVVDARVSGVREIGWRCNNDGIDIVSSQNVMVENCFLRSADDAISVKGLDPGVSPSPT